MKWPRSRLGVGEGELVPSSTWCRCSAPPDAGTGHGLELDPRETPVSALPGAAGAGLAGRGEEKPSRGPSSPYPPFRAPCCALRRFISAPAVSPQC